MKVTLIDYTADAVDVLLFTKHTRLNMSPALLDEIRAWPPERKADELAYMAQTIPSSWEFVSYTFLVEGVSRAYTHQQVRTRAASYAQQSLRVVDAGDFEFVWPERLINFENSAVLHIVERVLNDIKQAYRAMRACGVDAEDARSILPTNIATNIVCRFNLRTLAELATSRTGGRTQGEYRAVLNAMVDRVLEVHPWAEQFLFRKQRDHYTELERWAEENVATLTERAGLLKIVDRMRKEGV